MDFNISFESVSEHHKPFSVSSRLLLQISWGTLGGWLLAQKTQWKSRFRPLRFEPSLGQRPSATWSTLYMAWLPMINYTGRRLLPHTAKFQLSISDPSSMSPQNWPHQPLTAAVMKPLIIYVTVISHGIIKSAISHRLAFVILNEFF